MLHKQLDSYSNIEQFQKQLIEWERGVFLKERIYFRKMMNLMLGPLERTKAIFPVLNEKDSFLMLTARLINDFEAAMQLILMGLFDQSYMPIRDAIETMLLMALFAKDDELAMRWMTNLKEYQAGNVIAILKQKYGVDLPLNNLYHIYSQLGHVNFVACLHVLEEFESEGGHIFRKYHFGGYQNERFAEQQLRNLLIFQVVALRVFLAGHYSTLDPEFDTWIEEVRHMPQALIEEFGLDVEINEEPTLDRIGRKLAVKMNIINFGNHIGDVS